MLQDQNDADEDLGSSQEPNQLDYKKVRKYYACPVECKFSCIYLHIKVKTLIFLNIFV